MSDARALSTRVVIAGGGPAGMMLAYLLARGGIDVVVLEKWPNFFRDFRGDTIHPSTMDVLHELGLLDEFLKLNHNEVSQLGAWISGRHGVVADFSRLKTRCKFIAFIPQWDFLNFIERQASRYPSFKILKQTEVVDLIEQNGRITGLRAQCADGMLDVTAELVIGADGRHSTVREKSGLKVRNIGAPMDVLWFRLSRVPTDPDQALGRIDRGKMMITLNRGDYWQCGFIIRKGDFQTMQSRGLQSFRDSIQLLAPFMHDRTGEITDWKQISLLTVTVDCLDQWHRPGLLCIGDAAHAMSPIGGVGINLAIQDAIAAANVLVPKLRAGNADSATLHAIQTRRQWPARMTQRLQVFIQNHFVSVVLSSNAPAKLPLFFRLAGHFPILRRIPAHLIGIGFRPEHVGEAVHEGQ